MENDARCSVCPDRPMLPDGKNRRVCLTCGYEERRCAVSGTWYDAAEDDSMFRALALGERTWEER